MINLPDFVEYRYTDQEWDAIKVAVPNVLDQITRRSMEVAVSVYLPQAALNRQRPSRADLEALRKDAESLRARIDVALAERFNIKSTIGIHPSYCPRPGISHSMLEATDAYFASLALALDGQIKQRHANAEGQCAQIERDELWTSFLALWTSNGGKPTGDETARFLIAASKPVGADADIKTVRAWLRQNGSKVLHALQPLNSTDAVAISSENGDAIVPGTDAIAAARNEANNTGKPVTIRNAVTDKVLATVKPAKQASA